MHGQHATDIVGYTYAADTYCPDDMRAIAKRHTARPVPSLSVEVELDEWARMARIDRYDERSFDSDEFPKVIFADSAWDVAGTEFADHCATCGSALVTA